MTALPLQLPSLPSRGGCANGADGVVLTDRHINTTPALRATPPHLRRGVK